MDQAVAAVHDQALKLLATREYGFNELLDRLVQRGHQREDVLATVEWLCEQGMQSDDRFVDAYVHSRSQKGFGPLQITQELRKKGISDDLITVYVKMNDDKWGQYVHEVREKKYGTALPVSYQDRMKQSQFLHYRGFSSEQIRHVFRIEQE